jgi:uncharacterized metal-binding protein
MAGCCGGNSAPAKNASCCGSDKNKTVLIYACSGGANVAEISDRAARELMRSGAGTMFCLAGLGAGIPGMIQTSKDADVNLVIDGCPMDCARKVFEKAGVTSFAYVKVTDLGIEKKKGVPCTQEQVDRVVAKCREVLAAQK